MSATIKSRPILFSGAMVRALLENRKTQTRRILKPQPYDDPKWGTVWEPKGKNHPTGSPWYCVRNVNWNPITNAFEDFWRSGSPYGQPGDRLWVKETFKINEPPSGWIYRATDEAVLDPGDNRPWKPSIFMPHWASRITLEIESVRVERLQEISEADAQAEGSIQWWLESDRARLPDSTARGAYQQLWESINGNGSWALNSWCWVLTFRRITP